MAAASRSGSRGSTIVTSSFALDARWSGQHPWGYHATNVALHAAASALLFVLLRELAPGPWPALGGAVLFAVHPALASAVAWIPGRNDSLLAVFALTAWIAFARDAASPSNGWRAAHLAAFALALLTKETAVVIPLVCLAHVVLVRPRVPRQDSPSSPRERGLGGEILVYAAGWTAALGAFAALHAGLHAAALRVTAQSAKVLVASAGQILLPLAPTAFTSAEDLSVWPGLLAIGVLTVVSLRVQGVRGRVVALGATVFVLTLAPTLVLGGATALDCRLELPACGLFLAVVEVARARWRSRSAAEPGVVTAIGATAIAVCAVVTIAFEGSFRDPRSFAK